MASYVIHLAIASEINKKLNKNSDLLLIGAIAPDLSKQIGEPKLYSHFLDDIDNDIPNLDKFLNKYREYLDDDFVLGYYIHLYTDFLWFKYFMSEIFENDVLTKLNGEKTSCSKDEIMYYIYNDYTNINEELIKIYNLDVDLFTREIPKHINIIEEIPMDKLDIIMKKCLETINTSKTKKEYAFNIDNINTFIKTNVDLILGNILDMK